MSRHFTHYYFSNKLTEDMSYAISAIIRLYPDAYLLGSLGADVLNGSEFKIRLETADPVQVFDVTARHIFKNSSKCQLAYMLGYVTHYALDKVANPYSYYFAANGVAQYFGGKNETQSSYEIELGIDRHIIRDYIGIDKATELVSGLNIRKIVIEEISKLYSDVLSDVADINCSYHKIISLFENIKLDIPLSEGMGRLDYMNRENRAWHLINSKENVTLSFDEMMVRQQAEAYSLLNEYMAMARSNKMIDENKFSVTNFGNSARK